MKGALTLWTKLLAILNAAHYAKGKAAPGEWLEFEAEQLSGQAASKNFTFSQSVTAKHPDQPNKLGGGLYGTCVSTQSQVLSDSDHGFLPL